MATFIFDVSLSVAFVLACHHESLCGSIALGSLYISPMQRRPHEPPLLELFSCLRLPVALRAAEPGGHPHQDPNTALVASHFRPLVAAQNMCGCCRGRDRGRGRGSGSGRGGSGWQGWNATRAATCRHKEGRGETIIDGHACGCMCLRSPSSLRTRAGQRTVKKSIDTPTH